MSLGKDLASIRKSQNLSLEDIQNATKIPIDTLKRIESGRIFSDPDENKTYIRSFVRSYAKVLKIDDEVIIQALDELDAGTYTGSLLTDSDDYTEESDREPEDTFLDEGKENVHEEQKSEPAKSPAGQTPEPPRREPSKSRSRPIPQGSDSVDWAGLGHKYSPAGKNSKIWLVVFLVLLVLGLAGAGFYYSEEIAGFFSNSEQESAEITEESSQDVVPPAPIDSAQASQEDMESIAEADETPDESISQETAIILGDTLTVTVYAAYGQLEPVRVTSDLNWQTNPFWMEQGLAYRFDFRDTLLVRGQYSRLLLLFNGHVIENPRQNYFDSAFNSIMITRSILNQQQYLAPPPEEFPLEVGAPDTVTYRLRF